MAQQVRMGKAGKGAAAPPPAPPVDEETEQAEASSEAEEQEEEEETGDDEGAVLVPPSTDGWVELKPLQRLYDPYFPMPDGKAGLHLVEGATLVIHRSRYTNLMKSQVGAGLVTLVAETFDDDDKPGGYNHTKPYVKL